MSMSRQQSVGAGDAGSRSDRRLLAVQDGFEEEVSVPLARMEYGTVGQSYVLLKREAGSMTMGKLGACLQFKVKEIDPSTGQCRRCPCTHCHGSHIALRLPLPAEYFTLLLLGVQQSSLALPEHEGWGLCEMTIGMCQVGAPHLAIKPGSHCIALCASHLHGLTLGLDGR